MKFETKKYTQDLRKYYRMPAVQASLTMVLSLFVIAFFIGFALRPTIVSIVTLKKTIVEAKKTLTQLDTKVSNLQKASTQLETIKPFLPTLNTDIPNNGAMYSPLATSIESLALQTGTVLESESFGSTLLFSRVLSPFIPNKGQSVVMLPFSVRVTGNYESVSLFLNKLVSMERIVIIDSATISREANTKTAAGTVALNVTGNAYYLADQALLDKATAASKEKK